MTPTADEDLWARFDDGEVVEAILERARRRGEHAGDDGLIVVIRQLVLWAEDRGLRDAAVSAITLAMRQAYRADEDAATALRVAWSAVRVGDETGDLMGEEAWILLRALLDGDHDCETQAIANSLDDWLQRQ